LEKKIACDIKITRNVAHHNVEDTRLRKVRVVRTHTRYFQKKKITRNIAHHTSTQSRHKSAKKTTDSVFGDGAE